MIGGFYEWNVVYERWFWGFVIFNLFVVIIFNRGWEDIFKKYRENIVELKKIYYDFFYLN